MSVALAPQRDEEISRLELPRVDRDGARLPGERGAPHGSCRRIAGRRLPSVSALMPPSAGGEGAARDLAIIERSSRCSDLLIVLMPLAREEEGVVLLGRVDGMEDRLLPIRRDEVGVPTTSANPRADGSDDLSGSSVRGLSLVSTIRSAAAAHAPISLRFP